MSMKLESKDLTMDKDTGIFDRMISFIKNHGDDGIIKNKDGRIGKLVTEDSKNTYIICEGKKTYYDFDGSLTQIEDDGWIFE